MIFDSDMICRAGAMYKACPMCGRREHLKLRKAERFDQILKETQRYFSISCEACKLTFGEVEGEPVVESESDLIAAWNVRAY
jgi:predicted nucleic-acid-binding Zn-ribbon protein